MQNFKIKHKGGNIMHSSSTLMMYFSACGSKMQDVTLKNLRLVSWLIFKYKCIRNPKQVTQTSEILLTGTDTMERAAIQLGDRVDN